MWSIDIVIMYNNTSHGLPFHVKLRKCHFSCLRIRVYVCVHACAYMCMRESVALKLLNSFFFLKKKLSWRTDCSICFFFLIFEITLLSEAFLASVEKDAKERAKRRRENKVLADGNCQSSLSIGGCFVLERAQESLCWCLRTAGVPVGGFVMVLRQWDLAGWKPLGICSLFQLQQAGSRQGLQSTSTVRPLSKAKGWI